MSQARIHVVKPAEPPLDPVLKSWLDEIIIPNLVKRCIREIERKHAAADPAAKVELVA